MTGIVVTFATEKGGSKKTTQNQIIAEMFAEEGYSVNILDFDAQGTMTKWIERRDELIENGAKIFKINLLQEFDTDEFYDCIETSIQKYDVTIIDPPGTDAEALREAYLNSQLIIIPVTPLQNDLETLPSIQKLLRKTQQRHNSEAIVRTMFVDVPTHANDNSIRKAKRYIEDIKFEEYAPLLDSFTKHRKIYSDAQEMGLTAYSVNHEQANFECGKLKKEIFKLLS